jgi:hypothetical protein
MANSIKKDFISQNPVECNAFEKKGDSPLFSSPLEKGGCHLFGWLDKEGYLVFISI